MKIAYRVLLTITFLVILALIISFARGYRLDFDKQSLTSTGIISVSAFPKAAKVYVNEILKGATDINLTLPAGDYQIEVKKDGYTSWKKQVKLLGELVLTLDVLLYPLNPSLSPLTNLGVSHIVPVAQSNKVLLFSETGDDEKDGIYIYESGQNPLSFFTPLKLVVLKKNLTNAIGNLDLKETTVEIAPDAKEGIFSFETFTGPKSYLLSLDPPAGATSDLAGAEKVIFFDISSSKDAIIQAWTGLKQEANQKILEAYPKEIAKVATDSFHVVEFSPDETKLLYLAKKTVTLPIAIKPRIIGVNQTPESRNIKENELYVYDRKEDRNYEISWKSNVGSLMINNQSSLQTSNFEPQTSISWYSDSKHLVINEGNKISFIDFDNLNKQTVYSGSFENNFYKVASDGKILILTNLNPEANRLPDLYAVGIR